MVYLVFSGLVVGGLVLGLTTLNAMVAQSSFKVDDLNARVERLQGGVEQKQFAVAELTAPDRIASAAARIGLQRWKPSDVKVIHVEGAVPGRGRAKLSPAGPGGGDG